MKAQDASLVYRVTSETKTTNMESADRVKLVKLRAALKKASADYDNVREEASKQLKPEGFDELNEKVQRRMPLTAEEGERYIEMAKTYNKEVEASVKEAGEAEVEIAPERLSAEAFAAYCDSNDFTLGQIEMLEEALTKSE